MKHTQSETFRSPVFKCPNPNPAFVSAAAYECMINNFLPGFAPTSRGSSAAPRSCRWIHRGLKSQQLTAGTAARRKQDWPMLMVLMPRDKMRPTATKKRPCELNGVAACNVMCDISLWCFILVANTIKPNTTWCVINVFLSN